MIFKVEGCEVLTYLPCRIRQWEFADERWRLPFPIGLHGKVKVNFHLNFII